MKKLLLLIIASIAPLLCSQAEPVVALTSGNRILVFDSATPNTITSVVSITGVDSSDTLRGIDFHPFSGGLYALGSSPRLYVINPFTGVATALSATGAFTPAGTSFGFDFNPVADRIRVTSDADENVRLNPQTGGLAATDTPLHYATGDPNNGVDPNVVGSAYTNSFVGAQATTLYDIDSNLDILAIQNPPNSGTLNTVGSLGLDTNGNVGFDISPATGVAYASMTVGGGTAALFTINLAAGQATLVGSIADAGVLNGESVVDIAIPTATRLLNLSTRGRVGQGEDVLIAGFIVQGFANSRFLFRGIGPSLADAGVAAPLADPVITVFNSNGSAVGSNDNWRNSSQMAEIEATGLAPENDLEAAVLRSLAPGSYTAVVTSKDGSSGVAVVEFYQLP